MKEGLDPREYLNNMKQSTPKKESNFASILEEAATWLRDTDSKIEGVAGEATNAKKIVLAELKSSKESTKELTDSVKEEIKRVGSAATEIKKNLEKGLVSMNTSLERKWEYLEAKISDTELWLQAKINWIDKRKADKDDVTKQLSTIKEDADRSIKVLGTELNGRLDDISTSLDKEVIDDSIASSERTYSSEKIEKLISKTSKASISYGWWSAKIDDTVTTDNRTRSSTKIQQEINSWGGVTWWSITWTLSNQTDLQTELYNKVTKNSNIIGDTKTKVTYDAKGLVTAGTDATTADIADSTNKRYVTDANLVVIGNTSGTNTWDQTSIVGITGTKSQFDTAVTDGNFLYVWDITQYTDELAQDAVGGMVNSTLTYVDGTPSLGLNLSNANTWAADQSVPDDAYDATGRNGSMEVPTKNAIRDKIESLVIWNVTKVWTPVDDQVWVRTWDGTIEWSTNLQFDGTKLSIWGVDTMTVNWSLISTHLAIHWSDGLTEAEIEMHRHVDTAWAWVAIYGARSRGTAWTPTIVSSWDAILNFTAVWYDGVDYATAAQIQFEVDGTPWSNDMPWRIVFNTSADWAQTLTERMRISAAWVVSIPAWTGNILTVDTSTLVVDATNHRVGIWTTAPTHALTFPTGSTWIAFHNVSDQTTNFERVAMGWSSNVYLIQYLPWWSWAARAMRLSVWNAAAADQRLTIQRNTWPFFEFWSGASQAYSGIWVRWYNLTNTISSGTAIFNQVSPTIVNSGTAGYIMNLLNPTETSTWSGVNLFQDFQLASSSVFTWTTSGLFWVKTQAPTHSVTLSSSTTWIALYNTADQTTNYERFVISRQTNILDIRTGRSWSWSNRGIRITWSSWQYMDRGTSSPWFKRFLQTSTTSTTPLANFDITSTASSNVIPIVGISPTISQSSTAWYTLLDLNPTESTTWSWAKNFLLCRKSSWSTIFWVSSVWDVTTTGIVSATWSITSTITGASSTVPVTITVDSSVATQTALLVQNATNYAHTGNLITGKLLNATDTWAVLKLENAGTGNYITADSVFSVEKSGLINSSIGMRYVASPGTDDTYNGISISLTAAATTAQWEIGYMNSSWKVALADASAIATASALFIATAAISADAAWVYLLHGVVRNDAWNWTVWWLLYLSETAGAITQTAPTATDSVTQIVWIALSADTIYWKPEILGQVEHT